MFRRLEVRSSSLSDVDSFRRQRIVFSALNGASLVILLALHTLFSSFWGKPPGPLLALLSAGILLRAAELFWFASSRASPGAHAADALTWASIGLNLLLAAGLAPILDRNDSQYFALLAVPVLESSVRFSWRVTLCVVGVADAVTFYWVWRYYAVHPPAEIGEYFEAGTISLIFAIVAVLVCLVLRQLRRDQGELARTIKELESTRERLVTEEKLAAVGRLGSAVAHEIRNPVAAIMSSLATARQRTGTERDEMLGIATQEAARLVQLTTDFLTYARPRTPKLLPNAVRDSANYAADVCRVHAAEKGVPVEVEATEAYTAQCDAGMIQQALINMIMNAVEASPANAGIKLTVSSPDGGTVRIDVRNEGEAIPAHAVAQLFEPFFTTKPSGTGLGLATARGIARAHGGDLLLAANGDRAVCFSLSIPAVPAVAPKTKTKLSWAES